MGIRNQENEKFAAADDQTVSVGAVSHAGTSLPFLSNLLRVCLSGHFALRNM